MHMRGLRPLLAASARVGSPSHMLNKPPCCVSRRHLAASRDRGRRRRHELGRTAVATLCGLLLLLRVERRRGCPTLGRTYSLRRLAASLLQQVELTLRLLDELSEGLTAVKRQLDERANVLVSQLYAQLFLELFQYFAHGREVERYEVLEEQQLEVERNQRVLACAAKLRLRLAHALRARQTGRVRMAEEPCGT